MSFDWILKATPKPKAGISPAIEAEALALPKPAFGNANKLSKLLPYQCEGVEFMTKRRGSLLADEMGLGKTVQAIEFCNLYPQYRRILVICPASLVLNWQREVIAWCNTSPTFWNFVSYHGAQYETQTHYDVVIVDEAHFIKNRDTERHRHVSAVCKLAKRVLLLTGTPMPNGLPLELWPLLQLVAPKEFDPAGFVTQHVNKVKTRIEVGPGEGAGFFQYARRYCGAKKLRFGRKTVWQFNGATHLNELYEWLSNTCLIRRLKRDVLPQLPAKRRQIITLAPLFNPPSPVDFTHWTDENYQAHVTELRSNRVAFNEISMVRHAQALEKAADIADLLYEHGCKTVIFAHHLDVIDSLYKRLQPKGAVKLTGSESAAQKQLAVDVFQDDPNCQFFVGSLMAAGTGLTLTAASHVVFVEIDWTPKTLLQAEDRVHRMGQNEGVLIQYYVSDGTLDAHIAKLLVKKFDRLEKAGLEGST